MRVNRCVLRGFTGVAVLLCVFSMAGVAFGQSATGTLTGTVIDPKGLAMANATVTVHSADTGVDMKPVMTNNEGSYTVPTLPPGTYDITAAQPGFATVQHKDVTLQVGQTIRIDIEMPVSAQQTLVTVTTEVPLLETEKTEVSQNVNENLVSNLPVVSRRWEQFALLTPGVNPDGNTGGMSFHGINNLYNKNSVDGANNNSNYDGGSRGSPASDGYTYSGDSIREFQVSSSGFSAEIGESAGGAVNAVTKSGTNQWHGDLFYNGRAANFNALDPVAKTFAATSGKPATQSIHQQHQWGGSVGGPLIKNRLFFFVTDDGYRKVNPLIVTSNQVNPPLQNFTCPTLTAAGITAGATVPSAAQCQTAKDYITAHFQGAFARGLRQDIEFIKLDSQLNQANHVSVVTNIRDWKQANDPALQTRNVADFLQSRFLIANWTMVIGSNKVNEFRFQWGKDNSFNSLNGSMGSPGVSLSGITAYGLAAGGGSWTPEWRKQISDNFSWTKGAHQLKFGVDLNFIIDSPRSAVNAGGNYTFSKGNSLLPNVNCVAPTVATGQTTANKQNLIFCDWLMDVYGKNAVDGRTRQHWDSFNQFHDVINTTPLTTFQNRFSVHDYAGFIQDNWKMRSNLTVNLGLRYDVSIMPFLPNSIKEILPILPAGSIDLPILDKYATTFPNDYGAIQPRLGVAWNVMKNTVIRFGGGVFVAKLEGHSIRNVDTGGSLSTTNCTAPETFPPASNPSCVGVLNFPNVYYYQQEGSLWTPPLTGVVASTTQPPTGDPTFPNSKVGIRGVDPSLRRPRVYSVDVAIEQKLPGNMNLSVGYSYARGVALPRGIDFNISALNTDPSFCSTALAGGVQTCNGLRIIKTYDVVDNNGITQTAFSTPLYSSRSAITAGAGVVAAPQYSDRVDARMGVLNGNSSTADSRYNGLLVSLRKPMSHGVEVLANYTLSKSTDNGQQGGGISGEGQVGIPAIDPFNNRLEQGYSGTDTRNRFVTSVVWAPGFGKASSGVMRQLVGGWSMASTFIAQNGSHYGANVSSLTAPSVAYTGYTPGSTASTTFTYSPLDGGMGGGAISSPGSNIAGRIAWVVPGSFVLPNLYNVDFRLTKQFVVKERYHIEVRGEAFNLFNTTLIQGVSQAAFDYATPSASTPSCWNGTANAAVPAGTQVHTNTCMVPLSTFGQPTTTTGGNLGARQLQAGIRFEF